MQNLINNFGQLRRDEPLIYIHIGAAASVSEEILLPQENTVQLNVLILRIRFQQYCINLRIL